MNPLIEKAFVKIFVTKHIQDRILFELSSAKNRNKAISRFAHVAEEILEPQYVLAKGTKITHSEIESELDKHCKLSDEVYVISMSEADGKTLPLSEALQICMDDYMPSIIICSENIAFVKTEVSIGSPMKFILKNI